MTPQEPAGPRDVASVRRALEGVRGRMRAAGDTDDTVRIVAVTKGLGEWAVRAAEEVGLDDVGENYADELLAKADVAPALRRHFIGRLQSNKVRRLVDHVACWQSVDRPKLVRELARRAPGATVLVQVDISGEETKGGCDPTEAAGLVESAVEAGLAVTGLMGVAAVADDVTVAAQFRSLRSLVDDLGLAECSMGMSGDLHLAVAEGATMVRVGTALFGPRPS